MHVVFVEHIAAVATAMFNALPFVDFCDVRVWGGSMRVRVCVREIEWEMERDTHNGRVCVREEEDRDGYSVSPKVYIITVPSPLPIHTEKYMLL